jgi:hypothetical protein
METGSAVSTTMFFVNQKGMLVTESLAAIFDCHPMPAGADDDIAGEEVWPNSAMTGRITPTFFGQSIPAGSRSAHRVVVVY